MQDNDTGTYHMDQDDLLRDQLKHAHSLNALVDNHRFSLLKLLLGFHGLVLSALVFKPDMKAQLDERQGLAIWLGAGIATIGLALFGTFLSQHVYMRMYKHWIHVLESHLHRHLEKSGMTSHSGSLSCDDNSAYVPLEPTLVLLLCVFTVLNIGVPVFVAVFLGAIGTHAAIMAGVFFGAHVGVFTFLRRPRNHTPGVAPDPVASQTLTACYKGNAIVDSESHRGWFVGPFMTDGNALLQSHEIEAKWGRHRAGEGRERWDKGRPTYSLSVLLDGHFVIKFADGAYELTNKGDFLLWGPHIPHTWRAEEDSTLLTIRWAERKGIRWAISRIRNRLHM
jgi:hypothetical protein